MLGGSREPFLLCVVCLADFAQEVSFRDWLTDV